MTKSFDASNFDAATEYNDQLKRLKAEVKAHQEDGKSKKVELPDDYEQARDYAYSATTSTDFFNRLLSLNHKFGFAGSLDADDHAAKFLAQFPDGKGLEAAEAFVTEQTELRPEFSYSERANCEKLNAIIEAQEPNVESALPIGMFATRPATPEDRIKALNNGEPVPAAAYSL